MRQDAFALLQAACKHYKLKEGLIYFANHKITKRFFTAFKQYVAEKNRERLNLIKIRAAFARNKELKRPLLALNNFVEYKAFQSLKMRT
jgi:hypothetical protein